MSREPARLSEREMSKEVAATGTDVRRFARLLQVGATLSFVVGFPLLLISVLTIALGGPACVSDVARIAAYCVLSIGVTATLVSRWVLGHG